MDPVTPQSNLKAFSCPYCKAFAHMHWSPLAAADIGAGPPDDHLAQKPAPVYVGNAGVINVKLLPVLSCSVCSSCRQATIWNRGAIIFPKESRAPAPSADLPEQCLLDYREAAGILDESPRGAAALLRLVIQKLCLHLGGKGKKIDDDIAYLVAEKELPERARKALDAVRVIGNNAVHPGEMDLKDDIETAVALFKAVNVIVHATITQPREMDALYDDLPDRAKAAADRRDGRETA
jgi:hypothetical protein